MSRSVHAIFTMIFFLRLFLPGWVEGAYGQEGGILLEQMSADQRFYTLHLRQADIQDVLRAIGQEYHLNIIVSEDVTGKLTLSFPQVTLEEALQSILKANNLIFFRDGDIIRIARSPFAEGEDLLQTRMIPVNFADVEETAKTVKGLLSTKGRLSTDGRTNTLIIRDVPSNMEKIVEVISRLDSRTPQVMIEAMIVEVNTSFSRELGVQWNARNTRSVSNNKFVSYGAGGTRGSSTSSFGDISDGIETAPGGFAVNLPASVGAGSGGTFGISYGTLSGTLGIDLQLSALEDSGNGKILSKPRILTLNNKEAKISTGTEILIPTTSIVTGVGTGADGDASDGSVTSGVTTIDAKLELTVKPHVTPDGQILMHLRTDKKEPDFSRAVENIPPLDTRSAETDLLIKDGETIVIGGIYTKSEAKDLSAVPWFHRIPVLGWLFKKEVRVENQTELMIFITPTVYH